MRNDTSTLAPLSIWQSAVLAALPAGLAYLAMWGPAPALASRTGQPFLWVAFIAHGLLNITTAIAVAAGVAGLGSG